jgi:AraC-like DNA-binding protein
MAAPTALPASQNLRLSEWASLKTHLLWIYDAKAGFPGGEGTASNQQLSAWLVREGQVKVRMEGKEVTVRQGQWVFLGQGRRWQKFSEDCHLLSLRFCAAWPSSEDIFDRSHCLTGEAARFPALEEAARAILARVERHFHGGQVFLMQEHGPLDAYIEIHMAFCAWFQIYVRTLTALGLVPAHIGHIDPRILKAHDLVLAHPLHLPFRETDIARAAGLSMVQLNRLFMRHLGRTVRRVYDERRTEHAIEFLSGSSAPIKQIAYDLGFSSLPHFSTWFRRKRGVSPQDYRNQGNLFF